ncbi:MAG: stage III sporulation protein AB [Eubacteriales bacterium]|nr:stage III sporulation protein AB [Eubacteriales bacterium]
MLEARLCEAAGYLPVQLRSILEQLTRPEQQCCEEIRLRIGQPLTVTLHGRERTLTGKALTSAELEDTLGRATEYSMHTFADSLRQGFVTVHGGHRIGVCGQTAVQDGNILSFRHISSLNIRVARQITGAADQALLAQLREGDMLHSALFLSPPGRGKTTLLRDISRQLSDGGVRVSLADERSELAALYHGAPQLDIGRHTDAIDGCPKAQAAMMLVKTMSPQLLVLDEITAETDVRAVEYAAHCGTAVLASAHAWDMDDFRQRPLYSRLLDTGIFSRIFCIEQDRTVRRVM